VPVDPLSLRFFDWDYPEDYEDNFTAELLAINTFEVILETRYLWKP
jgi:hypothetical protein